MRELSRENVDIFLVSRGKVVFFRIKKKCNYGGQKGRFTVTVDKLLLTEENDIFRKLMISLCMHQHPERQSNSFAGCTPLPMEPETRRERECKWEHSPRLGSSRVASALVSRLVNAGCTFSQSAFGESLRRELPETRLGDSLHSCRELWILKCDTRRQPGKTWDPLTRAHGPLKKRDFNEARHKRRGYTRRSKVRRVFQSTLSLSPCLGFLQQECTAGIRSWFFSGP